MGRKTFLRGEHCQVNNMGSVVRREVRTIGLFDVGY